jgi:hypothetical protein
LLSLEFTQSLANPNLYLRSDGILMLLYVDDISMLYLEDATKAAIDVKARLSEKYKITNLGPARQFLGIEIHREKNCTGTGTGTSTVTSIRLGQKAFITTILKRFNMQNAYGASTPMDPNVKLDLAEDRGEKELKDIKGYQAIVGTLMYAALATQPDISFAVAALCRYNSHPFTSHLTAANRVLQYLKSTADFPLHFSSTGSNDQLTGYTDLDWANDSADCKSQGGHVFSATELSRGSHESKISSPCQPSKPNTSLVPRAPVKQSGYSSCTDLYMAKTHLRSRSTATIRAHLVISPLGS